MMFNGESDGNKIALKLNFVVLEDPL
jgi:hypothetical protein